MGLFMNESKTSPEDVLVGVRKRKRIQAEVRYAMIAAKAVHTPEAPKTCVSQAFALLSNGFVLLLIGAFISSFLVPHFQRQYEDRKRKNELMQECLSQFLVYSNSLWEEHYAFLPLTQEIEIDRSTYIDYTKRRAAIKLKRYDAYAKVLALAVSFRKNGEMAVASKAEISIRAYALELNKVSGAIDQWVTGLYCTPVNRKISPCNTFDMRFNGYDEHLKIKALIAVIGNDTKESVAAEIVTSIIVNQ